MPLKAALKSVNVMTAILPLSTTPPLLPKYALKNNFHRGFLPPDLSDITWVEEQVCALYRSMAIVTRLYGSDDASQPHVFHGNTCAFTQNTLSTAEKLPRTPSDVNDLLSVGFTGPSVKVPESCLKNVFRVRKRKTFDFLNFLRHHNNLYDDIQCSHRLRRQRRYGHEAVKCESREKVRRGSRQNGNGTNCALSSIHWACVNEAARRRPQMHPTSVPGQNSYPKYMLRPPNSLGKITYRQFCTWREISTRSTRHICQTFKACSVRRHRVEHVLVLDRTAMEAMKWDEAETITPSRTFSFPLGVVAYRDWLGGRHILQK
jgi:hypothetical protein